MILYDDVTSPLQEGQEWMDGAYKKCACTVQGQVECTCVKQEDNCKENFESYFDDNCELQCARGKYYEKSNTMEYVSYRMGN